ncbi:penicillin-binding protein activator [Shewanella gelidii]|nr:penicillin-binding protein activator [Shewanella gelidii]MCL1099591.1 penicillin-binding protein activator [Shewanella gelidii]
MLKRLNHSKLIYLAFLSSIIIGCGTTPPAQQTETKAISMVAATSDASAYMKLASETDSAWDKTKYLLLASEAYLNDNQLDAASELLQAMGSLTSQTELKAKKKYLQARLFEQSGFPQKALEHLSFPQNWILPKWQMAQYHLYRSELLKQNKQPLEQVKELVRHTQYVDAKDAHVVNDQIWSILQNQEEDTLSQHMRFAKDATYAGWLQLAFIAKHYAVDPNELVSYLGQWQQQNANHPGAMKLPTNLEMALNAKPYRPSQIAVLLPLTGKRAGIADAVKQGILSSYMTKGEHQRAIQFYDTNTGAAQAYNQAVRNGANFIIGPLLQSNVEALQQTTTTEIVPQLFLNQAQNAAPDLNRFYFSLSPAQEAADTAQRLAKDGIEMPLVLASNDAAGRRMAQSFNQAWQALTSEPAEVHHYDGDKMKQTVQQALGVTDSLERIKRIKSLLGIKLEADFRSRRDIDAIYMISPKKDLLLLKPFIDVNFSVFADAVPLYTSSRSRLDNSSTQTMQELNNLTISDIPWLLEDSAETKLVKSIWPKWSNTQKRLFIMGFDALDLVDKLAQMRAFPGYQYQGRGGVLSVTADGTIERQLSWAKYRRGKLRKL